MNFKSNFDLSKIYIPCIDLGCKLMDSYLNALKVDLKSLTIYTMEDDGGSIVISPVHPEIKAAQRKVQSQICSC